LCRDPKILILDEATSALDTATEKYVQQEIESLTERTLIIVAHRISTLENMDQIYVVEKGRIVEHGTYRELSNNPNSRFVAAYGAVSI